MWSRVLGCGGGGVCVVEEAMSDCWITDRRLGTATWSATYTCNNGPPSSVLAQIDACPSTPCTRTQSPPRGVGKTLIMTERLIQRCHDARARNHDLSMYCLKQLSRGNADSYVLCIIDAIYRSALVTLNMIDWTNELYEDVAL